MKNIFVFGITLVLISGIASALPNPASTYCEEMGYQLAGEMCIFPDKNSCEQWAFYRGECGQNYVHGVECAQAGEHSGVAIQCCEGLDEISNSPVGNDGICAYPIGAYPICSDCGNGICEDWENGCNCKEDCYSDSTCIDKCGDGICQEIVCQGTGCPCPETANICPQDCSSEICIDSDGGKNLYEKGTAKKGSQSLSDHCNSDGTITEKYCENNEIVWNSFECPEGYSCKDGACIKEETECYAKGSSCCKGDICQSVALDCVAGSKPVFKGCTDSCSPQWECVKTDECYEMGSSCCINGLCQAIACEEGTKATFGGCTDECKPIYECVKIECPQYTPPGPDFCKDGKIIDGGFDENGCRLPPKCIRSEEKYYYYAKWSCYDGIGYSSEDLAIPSTEEPILVSNDVTTGYMTVEEVAGTSIKISLRCKSYSEWQQEAEDTCKGHCSKETGKCGVNSFSVWGECTPPYETCYDSDNGKNYHRQGTTKSGSGKVKTDTCIECIGECQINGPCSEPFCYKVEEYFCGRSGIESSIYSCPNGCKDGACVALLTSKCNSDSDCGEGEKNRYCSGDSACIKAKYPQCLNPGTEESQCSWIGTGGCEVCKNGCSDGKCISGECGNGICEENEVCDVDCCEYYCQMYCPNGYVEGSCHCKCQEGPDVICTDSDAGPNYFIPGTAIGPGGSFFSDICDTNGRVLQEGVCTKEGTVSSLRYECPNGCEKGACIDEGDTTSCSGCSYESACLPIGFRRGTQYCDIDHQLKEQKSGTDACDNHHECSSNVCVSGKCVSPSFIDAIISWFSSLFGG